MDRDRRWDAQKKHGTQSFLVAVNSANHHRLPLWSDNTRFGKTTNFMLRRFLDFPNEQRIRDGNTVLFFNFRADRARQLSQAFLLKDFDGFDREVWPQVHFVSLTQL